MSLCVSLSISVGVLAYDFLCKMLGVSVITGRINE